MNTNLCNLLFCIIFASEMKRLLILLCLQLAFLASQAMTDSLLMVQVARTRVDEQAPDAKRSIDQKRDRRGALHRHGPFHERDCPPVVYLGEHSGEPSAENIRKTRRAQYGGTHCESNRRWLHQCKNSNIAIIINPFNT